MALDLATFTNWQGGQQAADAEPRVQAVLDATATDIARVYGPEPSANGLVAKWRRWREGYLTLPHNIDSVTSLELGDATIDSTRYTVRKRAVVLIPAQFRIWRDLLVPRELLIAGNLNYVQGVIVTLTYQPEAQTWRDLMQYELCLLRLAYSGYRSVSGPVNTFTNYRSARKEYNGILYSQQWTMPSGGAGPYEIEAAP